MPPQQQRGAACDFASFSGVYAACCAVHDGGRPRLWLNRTYALTRRPGRRARGERGRDAASAGGSGGTLRIQLGGFAPRAAGGAAVDGAPREPPEASSSYDELSMLAVLADGVEVPAAAGEQAHVEYWPRAAALLRAPAAQQARGGAARPEAKRQRVGAGAADGAPGANASTAACIALPLPPEGLAVMSRPHLLLMSSEQFPDTAVLAPRSRCVSREVTPGRLFGLWICTRDDGALAEAAGSSVSDGSSSGGGGRGGGDGPFGAGSGAQQQAWPGGGVPVMWAALPLGGQAAPRAHAAAPASGELAALLRPEHEALCGEGGGCVTLHPGLAEPCTWAVEAAETPAAPAASSSVGADASSDGHAMLHAGHWAQQQQQQQHLAGQLEEGEAAQTFLRVKAAGPDSAAAGPGPFRWPVVEVALRLDLLQAAPPHAPAPTQATAATQGNDQGGAGASATAAAAGAKAATAEAEGGPPALRMEILLGPGAPGSGGSSRPRMPGGRQAKDLPGTLRVAVAEGRCPLCWLPCSSLEGLAVHVKQTHDRLQCRSCPPDTLQVWMGRGTNSRGELLMPRGEDAEHKAFVYSKALRGTLLLALGLDPSRDLNPCWRAVAAAALERAALADRAQAAAAADSAADPGSGFQGPRGARAATLPRGVKEEATAAAAGAGRGASRLAHRGKPGRGGAAHTAARQPAKQQRQRAAAAAPATPQPPGLGVFYHCQSAMPVGADELQDNSDLEVDDKYEMLEVLRGLHAAADTTLDERHFMLGWNQFVAGCGEARRLGLGAELLREWAAHAAPRVALRPGLERCYAAHLLDLSGFGLLPAPALAACMRALRDARAAAAARGEPGEGFLSKGQLALVGTEQPAQRQTETGPAPATHQQQQRQQQSGQQQPPEQAHEKQQQLEQLEHQRRQQPPEEQQQQQREQEQQQGAVPAAQASKGKAAADGAASPAAAAPEPKVPLPLPPPPPAGRGAAAGQQPGGQGGAAASPPPAEAGGGRGGAAERAFGTQDMPIALLDSSSDWEQEQEQERGGRSQQEGAARTPPAPATPAGGQPRGGAPPLSGAGVVLWSGVFARGAKQRACPVKLVAAQPAPPGADAGTLPVQLPQSLHANYRTLEKKAVKLFLAAPPARRRAAWLCVAGPGAATAAGAGAAAAASPGVQPASIPEYSQYLRQADGRCGLAKIEGGVCQEAPGKKQPPKQQQQQPRAQQGCAGEGAGAAAAAAAGAQLGSWRSVPPPDVSVYLLLPDGDGCRQLGVRPPDDGCEGPQLLALLMLPSGD